MKNIHSEEILPEEYEGYAIQFVRDVNEIPAYTGKGMDITVIFTSKI